MNFTSKLPPFRTILPFAVVIGVIGWLGMFMVVTVMLPELLPRWLFFFFLVLALSATFLPVAYFLNIRFPSEIPVGMDVVVRQACWVGVYGGIIAWLQLGRILTTGLGVIIAAGLLVIEWFIRFREKNRVRGGQGDAAEDSDLPDDDE